MEHETYQNSHKMVVTVNTFCRPKLKITNIRKSPFQMSRHRFEFGTMTMSLITSSESVETL